MNLIVKNIPNSITCLNLAAGVLGIIFAFSDLTIASYMIFAACLLDFFDGFAARLLKVTSPIGKELDSLADVVSFGVLPGIILWKLFEIVILKNQIVSMNGSPFSIQIFLSLFVPVFSAVRLAKFNIDTRQTYGFIGLPTPANAIFFASLPLIIQEGKYSEMILNEPFLVLAALVMPALLISPIPLFALKFSSFSFRENKVKYFFLLSSLIFLLVLHVTALPLVIFLYILTSIVENYFKKAL